MKYRVTDDQLYSVMEKFFDKKFKGAVLEPRVYHNSYGGSEMWYGLWNENGDLLVGNNTENELNIYYFDGKIFEDEWKLFGITPNAFSDMMAKYLNEKYNMNVNFLM